MKLRESGRRVGRKTEKPKMDGYKIRRLTKSSNLDPWEQGLETEISTKEQARFWLTGTHVANMQLYLHVIPPTIRAGTFSESVAC